MRTKENLIQVSEGIEVRTEKEKVDKEVLREFCVLGENYYRLKKIYDEMESVLKAIKNKIVKLAHFYEVRGMRDEIQKFSLTIYSKKEWNQEKLREILGDELFLQVVERKEVIKIIVDSKVKEEIKQIVLKQIPKKFIKEGLVSIEEGTVSKVIEEKIERIEKENPELYKARVWVITLQKT